MEPGCPVPDRKKKVFLSCFTSFFPRDENLRTLLTWALCTPEGKTEKKKEILFSFFALAQSGVTLQGGLAPSRSRCEGFFPSPLYYSKTQPMLFFFLFPSSITSHLLLLLLYLSLKRTRSIRKHKRRTSFLRLPRGREEDDKIFLHFSSFSFSPSSSFSRSVHPSPAFELENLQRKAHGTGRKNPTSASLLSELYRTFKAYQRTNKPLPNSPSSPATFLLCSSKNSSRNEEKKRFAERRGKYTFIPGYSHTTEGRSFSFSELFVSVNLSRPLSICLTGS